MKYTRLTFNLGRNSWSLPYKTNLMHAYLLGTRGIVASSSFSSREEEHYFSCQSFLRCYATKRALPLIRSWTKQTWSVWSFCSHSVFNPEGMTTQHKYHSVKLALNTRLLLVTYPVPYQQAESGNETTQCKLHPYRSSWLTFRLVWQTSHRMQQPI